MARRNDHSREQLKNMALDAAVSIVAEEGMAALSTRKVAKAIGYTVGTLYHVFENFDDLVLHINALSLDELQQQITRAIDAHSEPREQIHALAQAYLDYARDNYDRWSLMFSHSLADNSKIPDWFNERVSQLFSKVLQPLSQLRNNQAAEQALRILWSTVHGTCELALNNKMTFAGEVDAKTVLHDGVENFLYGYINQRD